MLFKTIYNAFKCIKLNTKTREFLFALILNALLLSRIHIDTIFNTSNDINYFTEHIY